MTSPIAQIEQAIVDRLRAVARPGGLRLQVESYGGQLDDDLFAWARQLPVAWVTFDAVTEFKRVGTRSFKLNGTFEVFSAQRHLVQDVRRLNDDAQGRDIGAYQLVEQNKLALVNRSLGLKIQPMTPGSIRSVMKGMVQREAVDVLAQSFSTSWMEEFPEEALASDGVLVTIGLNYLLKPGDDVVDSTDVLTTRTT